MVANNIKMMIESQDKEMRELGIMAMLGSLKSKGDLKRLRESLYFQRIFSKGERKRILRIWCNHNMYKKIRDERRKSQEVVAYGRK